MKNNHSSSDTKQCRHYVSNKDVEVGYGGYLKWKGWQDNSRFSRLKKSEAAYYISEIKRTKKTFPEYSRVLEIGFGNGSFLKFASDNNWDISGTEINHDLVMTALSFGYSATHTDNLSGFNDDTFDLIVAFDVLEHIPQEKILNVLFDIKRILKKGGFFISRFPNGDSPFGLANQHGDITHVTVIGSGKANYFASKTEMDIVFCGMEAEPLIGISRSHFLHRIISLPIKKALNKIIGFIFYRHRKIEFCSPNLTAIYKK